MNLFLFNSRVQILAEGSRMFFFLFNVHLKVLHKNHSDRNWHLVLVYWFTLAPFFVCLQNLMGNSNIIQIFVHQMTNVNSTIQNSWNYLEIKWGKKEWKKSALFIKEWWLGVHSIFLNVSERVSALNFLLMSEIWAKIKK